MVNLKNIILVLFKEKLMKLFLNIILFLLASFLYEKTAFSLSDYQIKKMCQKQQKRTICLKNLRSKKFDLLQGNQIEIPVIPFKK